MKTKVLLQRSMPWVMLAAGIAIAYWAASVLSQLLMSYATVSLMPMYLAFLGM